MLRGVSGVLALTRDLGMGHLEGRGGVAGWALEATWETTPTAGGVVPGCGTLPCSSWI